MGQFESEENRENKKDKADEGFGRKQECSANEFNEFEERVFENLLKCGIDLSLADSSGKSARIGLAVSGGADSVSLLLSVCSLCRKFGKPFYVVTVNHRIRSDEESFSDAEFVSSLCRKLDVELFTKTFEKGEVLRLSQKRKCGIEEAARFLRYKAFDEFKSLYNLDYVLLAHNEDDNLETILMRFLQGSYSSGIRERRGCFVRPLLGIKRSEIESYLNSKKTSWRTDSTNSDENYLRNRIRKSLVPLLDEKFSGWRRSLVSSAEKNAFDEEYFLQEIEKIVPLEKTDKKIVFEKEYFASYASALCVRICYRSFSELGVQGRVPFRRISEFLEKLKSASFGTSVEQSAEKTLRSPVHSAGKSAGNAGCSVSHSDGKSACFSGRFVSRSSGDSFEISMGEISFGFDRKTVYFKKPETIATESSFFAIIEEQGEFDFPFGSLSVKENENVSGGFSLEFSGEFPGFSIESENLPVLVRSRQKEDRILSSGGTFKNVSDILSDWHVPSPLKDVIPLVQELSSPEKKIIALLGSVKGYKNWIVL